MNNLLFAIDIKAVLEDNTEVQDIKAYIIDNKRVYKTSDEKILPANKIKNIISSTITVPPELLHSIAKFEVQK